MTTQLTLADRSGQAFAQHHIADGQTLRIAAQPHTQYRLLDPQSGQAPDYVQLLRQGDDLHILIREDGTLTLDNYYAIDPSGTLTPVLGAQADGQWLAYPHNPDIPHLLAGEIATPASHAPPDITPLAGLLGIAAVGGIGAAIAGRRSETQHDNTGFLPDQPQSPFDPNQPAPPAPNPPAPNPPAPNPPAPNPPAPNPPAPNPPAPNPPAPNPPAPNPPAPNPPAPNPPAPNPPAPNPPAPNPPAPNPPAPNPPAPNPPAPNPPAPNPPAPNPPAPNPPAPNPPAPNPPAPNPPPNQAPTDIDLSATQIMENQYGAVVGTLSTTDPDPSDTHTYSVSEARFEVAGGELKLKAGEKLEFANEPTVTLEITATDAAGASYSETFTLQVQDDPAYPALPPGKLGVYVPKPANGLVVSVKDFGAKGDGQTDDAAAIQAAIDHVAAQGGGIVDIPTGTYLIDNLHQPTSSYETSGLLLKSNVVLRMTDATTLRALPNDSQYAAMITIRNADNAHILGGTLEGDRDTHTGKLGEWGHGVRIVNATNVVVENVTSSEFWGDGFYLGKRGTSVGAPTEPTNDNIIFYNVNAEHNRRQGMSITDGKNIRVLNSVFQDTDGTDPRAGIDIEPNRGEAVENVEIRGNAFVHNRSAFIASNHIHPDSAIKNIVFADNTLRDNFGGISVIGVEGGQITGNIIHHSHAETNSMYHTHHAIRLQDGTSPTTGVTVSDNTLYGSYISNRDTHGNTIGENTYKASVYVRGVALAGQTLTAEVYEGDYAVLNPGNGNGTRIPGSGVTYRWFADGVEIPGAVRHTYTLTEAERGKAIHVEVAFTDAAGNREHTVSTATAPVGSQNHAPTDIILSPLVVAAGLVRAEVGALKTIDADGGDRFTYTVSDNRFEVSRDLLRLKEGQYIKPGENSVTLTVTAKDHAGATYSETFTLAVRPYDNDPPSAITLSASELMEGKAGAEIGKITVKDPNVGETFTYHISDSRFEIVGGTLKLKSGEKVDYATEKTIALTITATDSGGFSIRKDFTLNVQDDPNYPAPTPNQAPTGITLSNTTLTEGKAGATVGRLTTTDPDPNDTHTYTIGDSRFEIIGDTLKLKSDQYVDFANEPILDLTITATDSGGMSTQNTFTLNVLDDPAYPTPQGSDILARIHQAEANARAALLDIAATPAETATLQTTNGDNITAQLQAALDHPDIRHIRIPAGHFIIDSLNLDRVQNKIISGQGTSTLLQYAAGGDKAAFLAISAGDAENLQFRDFVLDMAWQSGQNALNAFQFTNADNMQIYRVHIKNVGKTAILAQGYADNGSGSKALLVLDSIIDGAGLDDHTDGFGIMVKDHSPGAMIVGNQIHHIKGGMGIGGYTTTLGNPEKMVIIDNHIIMQRSGTAFEGIGLTVGVDHSIIAYNSTTPSFDNGLSISSGHNLIVRNHVDGAWNHGIALESTHNTVIANTIHNIGLQNAALGETHRYGGIAIADGGDHLISGNTISGGDMAYAIKYNGTQSGGNQIGHNHISGYRDGEYNLPPHADDRIGDTAPDYGISELTPAQIATIADNAGPPTAAPRNLAAENLLVAVEAHDTYGGLLDGDTLFAQPDSDAAPTLPTSAPSTPVLPDTELLTALHIL